MHKVIQINGLVNEKKNILIPVFFCRSACEIEMTRSIK